LDKLDNVPDGAERVVRAVDRHQCLEHGHTSVEPKAVVTITGRRQRSASGSPFDLPL
jgi:hypothetical protein